MNLPLRSRPLPCMMVCLMAGAPLLRAGGAAYSGDGRWLFHLAWNDPKTVVRLDCSIPPSRQAAYAVETTFAEELKDIAQLPSGEMAVASAGNVWRWETAKAAEGVHPWLKAPEGQEISWLAQESGDIHAPLLLGCDPVGGADPQPLWQAASGSSRLTPVYCRRVTAITSLVFTGKGRFVFSSDGDLWHGAVENGEVPVLVAFRWLATAERESYPGTPMGSGAYAVASSAGRVFFHQKRLGGTGWGRILSVPVPVSPASEEFDFSPDLEKRLAESTRLAADLWKIADTNGSRIQFATAPDGSGTDYRLDGGALFLPCEKPGIVPDGTNAPQKQPDR